MKLSRKISVVAATFLLAAATGQFMEKSVHRDLPRPAPAPAPHLTAAATAKLVPVAAPLTVAAPQSDDRLRAALPRLASLSPTLPATLRPPVALPAAPATATADPEPSASAATCHPAAEVTVAPGALLDFRLDAPCHARQRVVIRHGGLVFTGLTDAKGHLEVTIPAMQEAARVTATFGNDQAVSAATSVPELSLYDRVAVQWVGKDAFDVHALEFGADFGSAGDIWSGNPGAGARDATLAQGFMTVLGNDAVLLPMVAQVYTYPTWLSATRGTVKMVVDAAVTPATCGREMRAQTLRTQPDGAPKSTDLTVEMPECGNPGGYVELAGLLPDIKIAGK